MSKHHHQAYGTSLTLGFQYVMNNWQKSKQAIHWPVSRDNIASSGFFVNFTWSEEDVIGHRSGTRNLSGREFKPEKNSGLNGS